MTAKWMLTLLLGLGLLGCQAKAPASEDTAVPEKGKAAGAQSQVEPESTVLADEVSLKGAVLSVVIRPDKVFEQLDIMMKILETEAPEQATSMKEGLAAVEEPLKSLAQRSGWATLGLDVERPISVFVAVSPADKWSALVAEARANTRQKSPAEAAEVLKGLSLVVRLAVPVRDGKVAEDLAVQYLTKVPERKDQSVAGYRDAFTAGPMAFGLKLAGDHLLLDMALSQAALEEGGADTSVVVLQTLEAGANSLPSSNAETLLQVAVDVDALGTAELHRGWLAGSSPEDLKAAHGLSLGGPYASTLFAFESGERERIVVRNTLRKDASALVETLGAIPSAEAGDVMGVMRLLSSVAASTGPWAEAGFAAPAGMTWGQLQDLLGEPSVLTYAPGLWLSAAPSLGFRAVPEPMRYLDLAGDYSLQVIVENDFTPQTMKATLVVFGPSGKGSTLLTSLGCLSKGQPLGGDCVALDQNQGTLPVGGVDAHYGVEDVQGQTKFVLSGAEALVAGYLSAKPGKVDAASVELFALRVDLAKLLASGIFPIGANMEGLDKMVTGKAEFTVTLSPKDLDFKFEVGKKGTLLGMQAAIAIPAFAKYLRQAKEAEPMQNLRDLAEGATVYVETERLDANGAVIPPTFPLSVDISCAEPMDTPVEPQGIFAVLGFTARTTRYQYCYRTTEDGLRFAAGARADLDGDGLVDSAFCVRGMMNEGFPYLQMPEKTPVDGACIP